MVIIKVLYYFQEIALKSLNRTKTDTGGQIEKIKVFERIVLKELGKMTP
jgi:hypothetical protein